MWNENARLFFGLHFFVWLYFVVINLLTFILYGVDKSRAIKAKWRIPEKTLLLFAVSGGSVGAVLGMQVFHHKTKRALFRIAVPLILIIQVLVYVMYVR